MADVRNPRAGGPGAPGPRSPRDGASPEVPLEEIRQAVESIQFGTVQIVVQDGRVVQIDKTEKIRFA